MNEPQDIPWSQMTFSDGKGGVITMPTIVNLDGALVAPEAPCTPENNIAPDAILLQAHNQKSHGSRGPVTVALISRESVSHGGGKGGSGEGAARVKRKGPLP